MQRRFLQVGLLQIGLLQIIAIVLGMSLAAHGQSLGPADERLTEDQLWFSYLHHTCITGDAGIPAHHFDGLPGR